MAPLKEKAKNKCYLSLSTHDKRKRKKKSSHTCHKLTWESALWKYCLLEKCWCAKRKDRTKEGETVTGVGKNLMICTPACCQHTRSVWFYLDQHYTCTHLYSQTHTTTTRWDRSTKQPLGNFVPCRFTYCPRLQPVILKVEEKLYGAVTWREELYYLSVDQPCLH